MRLLGTFNEASQNQIGSLEVRLETAPVLKVPMYQHDLPHAFIGGGRATSSASVDARVRPNLRLTYAVPPADHRDDQRFSTLLEALARRTGHARQIVGESVPAL